MTHFAQAAVTIQALAGDECAALGLRVPLAVEIDCDGAGFVAKVLHPAGIDSFGNGPSVGAAITDLVEVMRAEASSLRARQERLSSALARELSALERVLVAEGTESIQSTVYVGAPIAAGAIGPTINTALARNSYIPFPVASELPA